MKTFVLLAALGAAGLVTCLAQEPSVSGSSVLETPILAPAQDLFPVIPSPAPAEAAQPEATPAPARPEATPAPSGAGALKKGTAEQLRQAIRMRELKTQALCDPAVQAEFEKARAAKTEEGRRVLMRNYYTLLYTKIEKLDASLYELAEKELRESLVRYEQHQVRPSVLIEKVTPLPGSRSEDHPGTPSAPAPQKPPLPSPTPEPVHVP